MFNKRESYCELNHSKKFVNSMVMGLGFYHNRLVLEMIRSLFLRSKSILHTL